MLANQPPSKEGDGGLRGTVHAIKGGSLRGHMVRDPLPLRQKAAALRLVQGHPCVAECLHRHPPEYRRGVRWTRKG